MVSQAEAEEQHENVGADMGKGIERRRQQSRYEEQAKAVHLSDGGLRPEQLAGGQQASPGECGGKGPRPLALTRDQVAAGSKVHDPHGQGTRDG